MSRADEIRARRIPIDVTVRREGIVGPVVPWRRVDAANESIDFHADAIERAEKKLGVVIVKGQDDAAPAIEDVTRGWRMLRSNHLVQDTMGTVFTDANGVKTVLPPTFMWSAQILAVRSDGVNFYVTLPLGGSEGNPKLTDDAVVVGSDLMHALLLLEDFRTCACVVGQRCERHRAFDAPVAQA